MDQIDKVPSVLNTPPILVKNNIRPLGLVSFQVLGDDDEAIITVNVPPSRNTVDLTHYAPFHNLVMSSAFKRLVDEEKLLLLNKPEIDTWIKEKCPESGGECPIPPGPELKEQAPLTFDSTPIDSKVVKGSGEKGAVVSLAVGSNIYYALITDAGTFEIDVTSLSLGTFTGTAIKTGYKDATGTLTTTALEVSAELVVNAFECKGTLTGTAEPEASITARTPAGIVTAQADDTGAFTLETVTLYDKDENYTVDVVAALDGHEPKAHGATGSKIDIPTVTVVGTLTVGDTVLLGKTEPNAVLTYAGKTAVADAEGNFGFVGLDPVADKLTIEFGAASTSIYKNETTELTPVKRAIVLTGQNLLKTDTEIELRAYGVVAGLAGVKVTATVGSTDYDGTGSDTGVITISNVDLSAATEVRISTDSDLYTSDDLILKVTEATTALLDQEPLTVTDVVADAKSIRGSGEPGAIVGTVINNEQYFSIIDGTGSFTLSVSNLVAGKFKLDAVKTGYNNSETELTIAPLDQSAAITADAFDIKGILTGTAQPKSELEVEASTQLVAVTVEDDGSWQVDTKDLYPEDKDQEIVLRARLAGYTEETLTVHGNKIAAQPVSTAIPVPYGARSAVLKTNPFARVKVGNVQRVAAYDGQVVFTFASPIDAPIEVEVGIDAQSIYNTATHTVTPVKAETYLVPNAAKQSDVSVTVHILNLITGLPLPKAELDVDGDVTEAVADVTGTLTFSGLDLTGKTEASIKLVSDVYNASDVSLRILTDEEAGNLKDQEPLTADAVYADATELKGKGEPQAIAQISIQGSTHYTRIGADGNWTIALPQEYSEPKTYELAAYKQGFKDATGQLQVNALKAPTELLVTSVKLSSNIEGTGHPKAKLEMTVEGYPVDHKIVSIVGDDGSFSVPANLVYVQDKSGELTVSQTLATFTPTSVKAAPTDKISFQGLKTDKPVTYGDQYFIIDALPNARISYEGTEKICDTDGQVLFRPAALTSEIQVAIGLESDSIYVPYTKTIVPNKLDAYFSTQTILTNMVEVTFQVYGITVGTELKAQLTGTGIEKTEAITGSTVKFSELDLTGLTEVKIKMVSPLYSDTEYVFKVTEGTITPPDET